MVSTAANQELEILERAIDGSSAEWSGDMAGALLAIRLTNGDVARMNELAAKSSAGSLDAEEEMQLDSYRFSARLLEILKLRARAALKRANASQPPSA
jgi:hypothetical protein